MAKHVLKIFLFVVVLILASFWATRYYFFLKPLPPREGELQIVGITDSIRIQRDQWGIPHIYATNDRDLFFASGFVQAQDRLFQMDLNRRAGLGRLSELFGETTLPVDRFIHTIGLPEMAQQAIQESSPGMKRLLQAFANGVNAYLNQAIVSGKLPFEYRVLGVQPEPWQPAHTAAVGMMMDWSLEYNYKSELIMLGIANKVGWQKAQQLVPYYPPAMPVHISIYQSSQAPDENYFQHNLWDAATALTEVTGLNGGSNSWVIAPALSESGGALLASDPHLSGGKLPGTWYVLHLKSDSSEAMGVTFPGVPYPLIGRNRHIAWGITNNGADVQDLYRIAVNPHNSDLYRYDDKWEPFRKETRIIKVKDDKASRGIRFDSLRILYTKQGAVLNKLFPGSRAVLSLHWNGQHAVMNLAAFWKLCRADNWKTFRQALSFYTGTPLNFLYADDQGNIGYQLAGSIPLRKNSRQWNTNFPADGASSSFQWIGMMPFETLPYRYNPKEGFIVSANNPTYSPGDPRAFPQIYAPGYRAARIQQLIRQTPKHTLATMRVMQQDSYSLLAEKLIPRWASQLRNIPSLPYPKYLDLLENWNGDCSTNSVAFTIYQDLRRRFAVNTFRDELGDSLSVEYLNRWYLSMDRWVHLLDDEQSSWFDDVSTPQRETQADILLKSWQEAITALRSRFGDNPTSWKWGKRHAIFYTHPFARASRIMAFFLKKGPYPMNGDGESINRAMFNFVANPTAAYDVVVTSSMRQLVDLSVPAKALGIIETGQSGHPGSRHFTDQIQLWWKGDYIPWYFDSVNGKNDKTLVLVPGKDNRKE